MSWSCHLTQISLFSGSGLCVALKEDLSRILLPYFRAVFSTPLIECDEFLESVWLYVLSLVLKWIHMTREVRTMFEC